MKNKSFALFKKAIGLIWSCDRRYFILKIVQSIYEGVYNTIGLFMLKNIVDSISLGDGFIASLIFLGIYCSVILIFQILFEVFDARLAPYFTSILKTRISNTVFAKSVSIDISCFEESDYYDKFQMAMSTSYSKHCAIFDTLLMLVTSTVILITSGVLSFLIDPIIIIFAFLPFVSLFIQKKKNKINHNINIEANRLNREKNYVIRTFYQDVYAKEMRMTNVYKPLLERFIVASKKINHLYKTSGLRVALWWILETFVNKFFSEYAVLIYAVWQTIVRNVMTYGDCLVVISTMSNVYDAVNSVYSCLGAFHGHTLYLRDYNEFLDYSPSIISPKNAKKATNGDICFRNVSFKYKNANEYALREINLCIKKGEKIAIGGENGAGKTTLVKLMMRLYDPTEGELLLNNIAYGELDLDTLRDMFSVVLQDYKLFSISIKDNIVLGTAIDEQKLNHSLSISGLSERIGMMPNGIFTSLDKEIDDFGEILSGGEQQKLSIACAYYKNGEIMVFDEPSSALDPIAEESLFRDLFKLSKGKTIILISHRLTSATYADRIVYLEHGRIAECGTHKQLMKKNGLYAQMFRIQADNYAEAEV